MARRIYTDDDLIRILQEAAELLGRPPTIRDLDDTKIRGLSRQPGSYTYKNRFGSWSNALRRAFGEHVAYAQSSGLADDEKLRKDMVRLCNELGRPPTAKEMSAYPGGHHANTYIRHYGSWALAVKAILPPF